MDPNGSYRIAIEKRGNNPGLDKQGLWCLPCGYLDWNESGTEAVKREVWEEIGLNLDDYRELAITSVNVEQPWHVKTTPDENRQNVTLHYGMVIVKKELPILNPNNDCEPNEVADAAWATLSDIQLNKYEFAFGHEKVIKQFFGKFLGKN